MLRIMLEGWMRRARTVHAQHFGKLRVRRRQHFCRITQLSPRGYPARSRFLTPATTAASRGLARRDLSGRPMEP